jgi:hypothetical protein
VSRHSAPDDTDPADTSPPPPARTPAPTLDPRVIDGLHSRVSALEAWRAHQTDLLDEILENLPLTEEPDLDDTEPDPHDHPATDDPDLAALVDWVHQHVAAVIARPLRGEHKWCPLWWEHPEALFRFTALHRAWTELAGEPGAALSIWIRDHLDPCLRELLAPAGPFADCVQTERYRATTAHTPLPTLPTLSTTAPVRHRDGGR